MGPAQQDRIVWKFQLEPRMDLGNGHTVTLTVSFRSSRRVIVHDGVRVEYTVREDRRAPAGAVTATTSRSRSAERPARHLALPVCGGQRMLVYDARRAARVHRRRAVGHALPDARAASFCERG